MAEGGPMNFVQGKKHVDISHGMRTKLDENT